jgi:hypothetical protein
MSIVHMFKEFHIFSFYKRKHFTLFQFTYLSPPLSLHLILQRQSS